MNVKKVNRLTPEGVSRVRRQLPGYPRRRVSVRANQDWNVRWDAEHSSDVALIRNEALHDVSDVCVVTHDDQPGRLAGCGAGNPAGVGLARHFHTPWFPTSCGLQRV